MSENVDLKAVEKRVYMMYHGDGLMDLFLGLAFLLIGAGKYYDISNIVNGLPVMILFCVYALKRAVTVPRIGYVDFGNRSTGKGRTYLLFAMLIPIVVGVILTIVFNRMAAANSEPSIIKEYGTLIYLPLLAIMIAIFGLAIEAKRLITYAAIFILIAFIVHFADLNKAFPFIWWGFVVTISGAFILNRFVKKYPKLTMDGDDVRAKE
jgi:hypothetical protein